MTITVNVYEAKTQLSALLGKAEEGEDVVIARNGRPVARLVAISRERPDRVPGAWRGQIRIADDFDTPAETQDADWYGETPA